MDSINGLVSRVPYLRRFARALTGSQSSGDAYVTEALEILVESKDALPKDVDSGITLFRTFCQVWQGIDVNLKDDTDDPAPVVNSDQHLGALKPVARAVFLLRMLEGFTARETAEILGMTPDLVERWMADANAGIARQLSSKIMIIEDETVTALDLTRLVNGLGHEVTSVAQTRQEAIAAIERERPALILADVHLADGSSGVDAVNEIMKDGALPVIFITGHPEDLLTGDRPEPTFLISKPYEPDAVQAMISQVLFFQTSGSGSEAA